MLFVSITELANGERVGMGAVEITTVPHLSILQKRFANVFYVTKNNCVSLNR